MTFVGGMTYVGDSRLGSHVAVSALHLPPPIRPKSPSCVQPYTGIGKEVGKPGQIVPGERKGVTVIYLWFTSNKIVLYRSSELGLDQLIQFPPTYW